MLGSTLYGRHRSQELHQLYQRSEVSGELNHIMQKYFYRQLQENDSGHHPEYQWLQKCWGEFNYIKANTYPIVFNQIEYNRPPERSYLVFNHQKIVFNPKLVMLDRNDNLIYDLSRTEFDGNLKYAAFTNEVATFLAQFLQQEKNKKVKRTKKARRKLTNEQKQIKMESRLESHTNQSRKKIQE